MRAGFARGLCRGRCRWRFVLAVASWLSAAAGLLGCNHASPSEPDAPAPGASGLAVVFVDDRGPLLPRFDVIRRQLEETYRSVAALLPIGGITVQVGSEPDPLATGWGVTGGFRGGTLVELSIQPDLPDAQLAAQLAFVAAHEFHHVARSRGPGYGFGTLLEAMVSEGLADHFALELLGGPEPPYLLAFSAAQLEQWLARARPLFDSRTYGHDAWFFGTDPEIPRWTGYALGFELVSGYQARHGNPSAASLWNTPGEDFRPD